MSLSGAPLPGLFGAFTPFDERAAEQNQQDAGHAGEDGEMEHGATPAAHDAGARQQQHQNAGRQ